MIYSLLIFLKINNNVHIVDKVFSEDIQELETIATERGKLTPEYNFLLLTYNLCDAKVME